MSPWWSRSPPTCTTTEATYSTSPRTRTGSTSSTQRTGSASDEHNCTGHPPSRPDGGPLVTRVYDDPATFTEDMLVGFLDAHAPYVVGVPGGVVRAQATRPGKVAVVVGGGSGHYPAFCGVVGQGFADGAVVGNVFTSPAAAEAGYDLDGVERVALLANDRTRTLGVAFDGCTMPGAREPLFTVPDGR